ncbi:hypothetical protein [Lysobacter humi (ex Lee et al. 2017)]
MHPPPSEDVRIAHCATCDRSATLAAHGDGTWCGWCGREVALVLRPARIVHESALRATAGRAAIDPENPPLQALRIPAGWRVAYNNGLYAVDPTPETIRWWWIFKQDMLVLVHDERGRLLDVGWSPEMDVEAGRYRLHLYAGDHHGAVLHAFETRDRETLVAELERLLDAVSFRGL